MKIILPKPKILAAFLFFVFAQTIGFGATITSTGAGGNWNSTSSWVGGVVPTASDDVVIASGSTVTVNVNVSAKSITVSGTISIPSDSNISINSLLVVITSPSGSIYFNKKSIITFPTNVSLYLQNGTNSLNTDGNGVCSNNTEIHVGTTNYAVCTGSGAAYTFDQVETAGGINTAIILSGNQYICTYGTNTTTFTSTVSGGTWSSGSPSIASVNSSTGVVTATGAGTATITYTVTGVGSATRDVYVAGSPGGGVSAINGSNSQCPGTTANYTITSNSANSNHTWSYASGTGVTFVTSADGRSATATFASNATSGQITVYSTNACGSGYGNNFSVTVDPVPSAPGTAGPHSPSCTQFTAQWAYTLYATKYYLDVSTNSGFSSFVSGYNNLDVGNVLSYALTGLNPGTTYYYRVRAYSNCGTSPSSTTMNYATTASPTVAPTVTAATSIDCNQAVLNWNSITNATAYYLDIATDSGFSTFVSGYNNLYIGYYPSSGYFVGSLPAGVLYYRVRATNVCNVTTGNSNTVSFQTTAPLGGSVSPAQTICAGAVPTSNLTLSGHTTTAGTVITNWQSATDAAFTTNVAYISETTNVLTSAKIGVLNVSTYFRAVVQNQFGSWCSTNSTPVLITVNNSVSAASSAPTVCVNTVMTNITHTTSGFTGISNSGVSGANGLPAGVSASFASNVVTISGTPTVSGSFTYSIPLTGGSCGGANATGSITVNDKPTIASISTPSALCAGASLNPATPTVTNNGSTVTASGWQLETAVSSAVYSNIAVPYTVAYADNGKRIRYYATNACGTTNSNTATLTVTASVTPSVGIAITSGSNPACSGSSVTFTATPTNGGTPTYQWTKNGTNIGGATSSTYTGTAGTDFVSTDIIRCVLTPTAICVSPATAASNAITITVNPTPTLTSATQTILACDGSGATINLTGLLPNSSSTISYTINGGSILTETGVVANGSGSATFTTGVLTTANDGQTLQITGVTTTTTSCTKSFAGIAVILNVKSNSGAITMNGSTIIPSGGSTTYSELSSVKFSIDIAGATGYIWHVPSGWTITAGDGTREITATTGSYDDLDITVSVMAINSFCPSSITVALSSIPPSAPVASAIVAVSCNQFGSVTFNNLPDGFWTLTKIKGVNTTDIPGSGNTLTVNNLTAGDYTFKITNARGATFSGIINVPDMPSTTWNGGASWSNGLPDNTKKIILNASGTLTGLIEGCSCEVNSNKHIIFDSSGILKLENDLKVDALGSLTFENNASLIQTNDNAVNNGSITYKRTTPGLNDLDYEYWSSPVAGQTLGGLWPSDRYFRYTNGAWEAQTSGTAMDIGRGYIIRVRTNSPPFYQSVEFNGVPNNGIKTITAQGANKSNLIGNPYPSAIDAEAFILDPANSIITGSLYFWTHFSARRLDGTTYKYEADDYALFSLSGSIGTAPSIQNAINNGTIPPSATIIPSGKIAAGQSFFVISDNDGDFTFNNSMRFDYENGGVNNNSQFFKPSGTKKTTKIEKDRIWLNLSNDEGAFKQLLVGYITGATNDFDKLYDGVTRNGNAYVDFYSVNNSKNYTIQGRGLPFDKADEVPLGYKSTIAGTFQIGIDNVDGSMVNQAIYLEDKVTNTIHDLKSGSYSFTTATGVFNDRFVLRYTNTSKLGTGDVEAKGKGVFVSVRNREIKINSFDQTMSSVKVYDLKGSLVYEKNKVDKNEFIVDTLYASNQFMIVMIQLEDGKWISEEIIFHD